MFGGVAVALGVHAVAGVALRPARAQETPVASAASRRAAARAERLALSRTAEADVAAGRVTLGETIIRLGWLDHVEEAAASADAVAGGVGVGVGVGGEGTGGAVVEAAERESALATYRLMLGEVRGAVARGLAVHEAIVAAIAKDGRAGRYKRMYPRLVDALANGGGNCVALSTLAVSLAHDAGFGARASMRVYANHVAPDVRGFRFGMAKRCHGPGAELAAKDLIVAYATARATGDREPFAFPRADDACDDPGDVFGELQLVGVDPPPMERSASDAARVLRAATPSSSSSSAADSPAPREAECRRRTVLEEYEDDVEAFDADGRSLGGVGVPRAASLDPPGHATSAACFDRRAAALPASTDVETLVLALGDAAMAAEGAARVFAAAGEIDVAREYERRLSAHRARAAAPLERVIARLGDPNADVGETLAGAGRLVSLGEGGRTAMLLASERHRGFWELANLMTRPSSQLGAIKRWADKPIDVRLDVIEALPCASQSFVAQLEIVDLPAARALRVACDVRARADRETCALDDALAHTRARTAPGDRDALDLAEAVLVRYLSARCRTSAFVVAARRWATTKPPPIATALARRLVDDPE